VSQRRLRDDLYPHGESMAEGGVICPVCSGAAQEISTHDQPKRWLCLNGCGYEWSQTAEAFRDLGRAIRGFGEAMRLAALTMEEVAETLRKMLHEEIEGDEWKQGGSQ
jgi:hypothetical protein